MTKGYFPSQPIDIKWKVKLKVRPEDAPEFEADASEYFKTEAPPNEGSTMTVLFDPHDHSKVSVEIESVVSAPAAPEKISNPQLEAAKAELGTLRTDRLPSPRKTWKMRGAIRELDLARARSGRGPMVVRGPNGALQGVPTPEKGVVAGQIPDSPKVDAGRQIKQLAKLRDRGILTEEQFEQAKRALGGD